MRGVFVIPWVVLAIGCETEVGKGLCIDRWQFYVGGGDLNIDEKPSAEGARVCLDEGISGRLTECPYPHEVKLARPTRMPSPASEGLIGDVVVEFDGEGVPVRFWSMPIDSRVYAVEGSNIFIRQREFGEPAWRYLKISDDRSYSYIQRPISEYRSSRDCPSDLRMYSRPLSIECANFKDLVTGEDRWLAVSKLGPCWRIGPRQNRRYFEDAA